MTLIALHMLQNHAPSNLNRDDNGDPKDCLFGGTRRARISSQALKRSIRWSDTFRTAFTNQPDLLATRTQLLPEQVRERLPTDLSPAERDAILQQTERLGKGDSTTTTANEGNDTAKRKTAQLMFLTHREIDQLTERMVAIVRDENIGVAGLRALKSAELIRELGEYEPHAVDIAMFGRMTTSSPFKNIEAAVQVAPALSTHTVEQEFDYYTAVDDISGESGAGFIGETAFNSATYYKYISIHWEELIANLQGDAAIARTTIHALLHAAMTAIPTGKQNSFAAHNLPDLVLVEVREQNIALSYANAFVKPVRANAQHSLLEASALALQTYIPTINQMHGLHAQQAYLSTVPFALADAHHCTTPHDLFAWLPLPTNTTA